MTVTIDLATLFTVAVGGLFVIVGIGIVSLFYRKVRWFILSRRYDAFDRGAMRKRWQEIERLVGENGEMGPKMAVLEADKLLDHALRALSFPGESLGDRLKFAAYKYPQVKDVWWAHKVRNQLAHEATYYLDRRIAKKAIATFRRALERLGAI